MVVEEEAVEAVDAEVADVNTAAGADDIVLYGGRGDCAAEENEAASGVLGIGISGCRGGLLKEAAAAFDAAEAEFGEGGRDDCRMVCTAELRPSSMGTEEDFSTSRGERE